MQDTLILVAIIALIVGLLLWEKPNLAPSHALLSAKGESHEIHSDPVLSRKATPVAIEGKSRRSAHFVAQSEGLPSIYDSKKLNTVSNKKQKVVHGVPLNSFVQNSLNTLPGEVPPQAPNGVRVFLQCVELRPGKNAELNEKECNELVAKNSPHGKRYGALGGP